MSAQFTSKMVVTKVTKAKPPAGNTERVVASRKKIRWGDMGKVHFIARAGTYKIGDKVDVTYLGKGEGG